MPRFRERPLVVEAVQLTPAHIVYNELTTQWELTPDADLPDWVKAALSPSFWSPEEPSIRVATVRGDFTASLEDWFVRGTGDVVYTVMPGDIFADTYELVE